MKGNVSADQAVTSNERPLSPRVQEALGELVGVAQEGLLALSVGIGLGVITELMEEEVTEVVGPKGRHDPERRTVRHGHEAGEVTLGGRRVGVERPRVRAADGAGEVGLAVYRHFADRDPLARVVLERMLAGVSCRRYGRTGEPVGVEVEADALSVSKSAISRTFIDRTRQALAELVERGPGTTQGVLCVLDGSKALRKAVRDVLGDGAPVERLHPPQGAQHSRSPAQTRPGRGAAPAASGMGRP